MPLEPLSGCPPRVGFSSDGAAGSFRATPGHVDVVDGSIPVIGVDPYRAVRSLAPGTSQLVPGNWSFFITQLDIFEQDASEHFSFRARRGRSFRTRSRGRKRARTVIRDACCALSHLRQSGETLPTNTSLTLAIRVRYKVKDSVAEPIVPGGRRFAIGTRIAARCSQAIAGASRPTPFSCACKEVVMFLIFLSSCLWHGSSVLLHSTLRVA